MNLDYFSCISLSELSLEKVINEDDKKILYASLAITYNRIGFWTFAEYYYLESISLGTNDINLFLNLANMYFSLNSKSKLRLICNKILEVNPYYEIPEHFVD